MDRVRVLTMVEHVRTAASGDAQALAPAPARRRDIDKISWKDGTIDFHACLVMAQPSQQRPLYLYFNMDWKR